MPHEGGDGSYPETLQLDSRTHAHTRTCRHMDSLAHSLPQDQSHATNTYISNRSHYAVGARERELATPREGP